MCCCSTGCPTQWIPARMKKRRRPESECDRAAPFHWCAGPLTEGPTRKERRLCHRFSGSIGNARMRTRSGKNERVSLQNKKNRPVARRASLMQAGGTVAVLSPVAGSAVVLIKTFAASISFVAPRSFCLLVYSYVYVVAVNKCGPFLWITVVYPIRSVPYQTHNRAHSVCGCNQERWVTFGGFCARRSYPVYVHMRSTRVARAIRQVIHSKPWITLRLKYRGWEALRRERRRQDNRQARCAEAQRRAVPWRSARRR